MTGQGSWTEHAQSLQYPVIKTCQVSQVGNHSEREGNLTLSAAEGRLEKGEEKQRYHFLEGSENVE